MVPVNRDERALNFTIVCRSQSEKASAIEIFESLGYENRGVSANTWESFPYVYIDSHGGYHIEASKHANIDTTMTLGEAIAEFDENQYLSSADIIGLDEVI